MKHKIWTSFYLVRQSKGHLSEQLWVILEHVVGMPLHVLSQEERGHVWGRGRWARLQQLPR